MTTTSTSNSVHHARPQAAVRTACRGTERPSARRAAAARAGSWTGRATVTFATDSHLSRLVTGGTFRTRVSEMRDVLVPVVACALEAVRDDAGAATSRRRWFPGQPTTIG